MTLMKTRLKQRLEKMHKFAQAEIAKMVADLARQDRKAAEKMSAKYSRLASTMQTSFLLSLDRRTMTALLRSASSCCLF